MLFGVQRAAPEAPAQVHAAAARGTGAPATELPYADQIQRSFGRHDISGVEAHVGGKASASAQEMGARAYATGGHIVLGEGADLHTVAHEAAHVVQQRGGVQLKSGVGQIGDAYEQHADAVADRVVRGDSAVDLLAAPPGAAPDGPPKKAACAECGGAPAGTGDCPACKATQSFDAPQAAQPTPTTAPVQRYCDPSVSSCLPEESEVSSAPNASYAPDGSSSAPNASYAPDGSSSAPNASYRSAGPAGDPDHSVKDKYQAMSYDALGVDKETFDSMDPVERQKLITGAYADMYTKNPEMKFLGGAAYATDKIGFGMENSGAMDMIPGGPDGKEMQDALAKGMGNVYEDAAWKHQAFANGGIDAMEEAAKNGDLGEDELANWRALAAGKDALAEAQKSGDPDAIKAAQDKVWTANTGFIDHEQNMLQDTIYNEHPEMDKKLSGLVTSPFPGGPPGKGDNFGDPNERLPWMKDKAFPAWRQYEESSPDEVKADMDRFRRPPELPEGGTPVYRRQERD
jgi:hypothetical protein